MYIYIYIYVYTQYSNTVTILQYNFTLGPSNWSRVFPYCNGTKQSPINIDKDSAEFDGNLTAIQLGDQWDVHLNQSVVNATLKNNGHTAVVVFMADGKLENSPIMTTQGGTEQN